MGWDCTIGASVDLGGDEEFYVTVYDGGHTYNCGPMFRACGAKPPMEWNGYEGGMLIPILIANLELFRAKRAELERLNPKNGWGSWSTVVEWQERILHACRRAPKAVVQIT